METSSIPGAQVLGTGRLCGELWERLRSDLAAEIGADGPVALEPVRSWSTLQNEVVKVRVVGSRPERIVFLKISLPGQRVDALQQEARRTAAFRRLFDDVRPLYDSAEVIRYYEPYQALVIRECPGTSLLDIIAGACRWFDPPLSLREARSAAEACGRWVRTLENLSLEHGNALQVRTTLLAEIASAERRIKSSPLRSWGWLAGHCKRIIEGTPCTGNEPTYCAHGDLHPGNLFVTSGATPHVTAIDLRLADARFPGYDALYFEHQLLYSFPRTRFRPAHIRSVLSAFWHGYGGRPAENSPISALIQAHLVLKSLVYLATVARDSAPHRRVFYLLEGFRWLRRLEPLEARIF